MTYCADSLRRLLERAHLKHATEAELQVEIDDLLAEEGLVVQREARLTPTDRIDFLVEGGVGIEVKTQGARNSVLAQLIRYAQSDQVNELVLVTTRYGHCNIPPVLNGKRACVALVQSGLA